MPRRSRGTKAAVVATTLCLLRHGDAGDPSPIRRRDAERALTAKGKRQARWAGKALKRLGLSPRDVWSSRLLRARETADAAADAAGAKPRTIATDALAPDADPEEIVLLLASTPAQAGRGDAGPAVRWIVGHEPHLSRLVHHLTGAPPHALRFGKGAVAVVDCVHGVAAGAGHVAALLPPSALRAIRRAPR